MKRRRKSRKTNVSKNSKRSSGSNKYKSLKERFLTAGIWALGLLNLVLIGSVVSEFFTSPAENPISMNAPPEIKNEIVTVEVLNGCGVQGLANDVGQYLRNQNFDVVNIENASAFNFDRTLVLDRVSMNRTNAKEVGKSLGVEDGQIVGQLDDSLQLKVTVIIGKDYKSLKIYQENR